MLYGFLVLSFFAVRRSEKRFYALGNKKGAESSAPLRKPSCIKSSRFAAAYASMMLFLTA
jgi:hypothetical protein